MQSGLNCVDKKRYFYGFRDMIRKKIAVEMLYDRDVSVGCGAKGTKCSLEPCTPSRRSVTDFTTRHRGAGPGNMRRQLSFIRRRAAFGISSCGPALPGRQMPMRGGDCFSYIVVIFCAVCKQCFSVRKENLLPHRNLAAASIRRACFPARDNPGQMETTMVGIKRAGCPRSRDMPENSGEILL